MNTKLYLIAGEENCSHLSLIDIVDIASNSGISIFQLREKDTAGKKFVELAKAIQPILKSKKIDFYINDRVDIAMASKANGVHVGQNDISYSDIRAIAGTELKIGLSTNTQEDILKANELDLEYIGIGPIFDTTTKKNPNPTLGIEKFISQRHLSKHPVVAIGGINRNNLNNLLNPDPLLIKKSNVTNHTDPDYIAVISAVTSSINPKEEIINLKTILDKAN